MSEEAVEETRPGIGFPLFLLFPPFSRRKCRTILLIDIDDDDTDNIADLTEVSFIMSPPFLLFAFFFFFLPFRSFLFTMSFFARSFSFSKCLFPFSSSFLSSFHAVCTSQS